MNQNGTDSPSKIERTLGMNKQGKRVGKRFRKVVIVALILLVAAIVLASRIGSDANTVEYKTQTAKQGNLTITVSATGNLEPTNQVEVGSELSGTVRALEADYNDKVKVGQVLARLDSVTLEAEVKKSRASLASAKAQRLQAQATIKEKRSDLDRLLKVRKLSGDKGVSQSDLDAARASLERAMADEAMAQAQIQEAEANLESAETNLSKSIIVSPINGVVLTRDVEVGQTVAASLEAPVLFTLAEDLTKMELHVGVDEADVGKVKEGQKAFFTVDAYPDRRFPAKITQVRFGAEETDGVITYETVLTVGNSDLSLRPGMTATAEITVKSKSGALLVPNAALRFSPPQQSGPSDSRGLVGALLPGPPRRERPKESNGNGRHKKQTVWTLRDGRLKPIHVSIGASDGSWTEITEGDITHDTALVMESATKKQ
jgi:HlyD family secretion protein